MTLVTGTIQRARGSAAPQAQAHPRHAAHADGLRYDARGPVSMRAVGVVAMLMHSRAEEREREKLLRITDKPFIPTSTTFAPRTGVHPHAMTYSSLTMSTAHHAGINTVRPDDAHIAAQGRAPAQGQHLLNC